MEEKFGKFRTALVGGFCKEEVMDYIDVLFEERAKAQSERDLLEKKLEEKDAQCSELEYSLKEKSIQCEKLEQKLEERSGRENQWADMGAVKTENEKLRKRNMNLQRDYMRLETEKNGLEQELAKEREKTQASGERRYVSLCKELEQQISNCEKQSAMISGVLADARVYANQLVANANAKADSAINLAMKYIQQVMAMKTKMCGYLEGLDVETVYRNLKEESDSLSLASHTEVEKESMEKDFEEFVINKEGYKGNV